jgi:hypothetical protein
MTHVIGTGEDMFTWIFVVGPVTVFVIGFIFRPTRTLAIAVAVLLLLEIHEGLRWGIPEAGEFGERLLWSIVFIGLPAWLLAWLGRTEESHNDQPRAPAD